MRERNHSSSHRFMDAPQVPSQHESPITRQTAERLPRNGAAATSYIDPRTKAQIAPQEAAREWKQGKATHHDLRGWSLPSIKQGPALVTARNRGRRRRRGTNAKRRGTARKGKSRSEGGAGSNRLGSHGLRAIRAIGGGCSDWRRSRSTRTPGKTGSRSLGFGRKGTSVPVGQVGRVPDRIN